MIAIVGSVLASCFFLRKALLFVVPLVLNHSYSTLFLSELTMTLGLPMRFFITMDLALIVCVIQLLLWSLETCWMMIPGGFDLVMSVAVQKILVGCHWAHTGNLSFKDFLTVRTVRGLLCTSVDFHIWHKLLVFDLRCNILIFYIFAGRNVSNCLLWWGGQPSFIAKQHEQSTFKLHDEQGYACLVIVPIGNAVEFSVSVGWHRRDVQYCRFDTMVVPPTNATKTASLFQGGENSHKGARLSREWMNVNEGCHAEIQNANVKEHDAASLQSRQHCRTDG